MQFKEANEKEIDSPSHFEKLVLYCIDADFTSKDSLESLCRDLQDLHTFAPLRSKSFTGTRPNFVFQRCIFQKSFFSNSILIAVLMPNLDEHLSEFRDIVNFEFSENGTTDGDLQKFASFWRHFLKFPKSNN